MKPLYHKQKTEIKKKGYEGNRNKTTKIKEIKSKTDKGITPTV